ncbi:MAG: hypothetical protein JW715_06495 [Sedimentisphaerales bacterium]|nr:hypothetical protein [Sedimentisphaerales bacterium]
MNFKQNFLTVIILFATGCKVYSEPSLTIYNQDFAIVRDKISLDLDEGENQVSVIDITSHLEPDSVILRDPTGEHTIQILEQNYRSDPVSQELLLSIFEGQEIEFLSEGQIIPGKVIRSGYNQQKDKLYPRDFLYLDEDFVQSPTNIAQPIIEVDGKLRFNLPGLPLFPSLSDDTILKPTLHWILKTDSRGSFGAELSYVTGGLSWKADYNMLSKNSDDEIDIIGWITFDNQSGKTFENAKVKLMAGDVNKIRRISGGMGGYGGGALSRAEQESVSEKSFDEYHLYTLNRQTTLHDSETKQVEFLRANNVSAERIYVYDGYNTNRRKITYSIDSIRQQRDYGITSNSKVWVMRQLKNSEENNLGIPLPKGRMRFYKLDDDGQLEFTGENIIDHTPKDETVRVYTGNAFDLVGERKRTDYQIDTSRNWLDESFEIKVRNHKEKDSVDIRVVEHLYRWIRWEIVKQSEDYIKTDSQTIEFRVRLKPGEEKIVTYKVRYIW